MLDEYDSVERHFGLPRQTLLRLGRHPFVVGFCARVKGLEVRSRSASLHYSADFRLHTRRDVVCAWFIYILTTRDTIMSNIQWSQEQIMLFLETLQAETIIWDPNDRYHKDKKKINDAWVRIRDIFGGSAPVEELKKKKDSLFATYRGYCRKIQAFIKSGAGVDDVYRPVWFAFEFMNSFLGSVFKCKQTIATDQETGSIEEENSASEGVVSIASPTDEGQNSIEPSQVRHTIRRRDNPPELQIASKQMTDAFNNLNKIINTKPAKDSIEVEDECDLFGKLIAKKLKKLPEHEREDLMFDIHALFRRSRVERSPSVESFRSSTPNYTSHHSLTPSLSSKKRPKSANSAFYHNAATFSPRPHSSHSEPLNIYQPDESQHIYINDLQRYVS